MSLDSVALTPETVKLLYPRSLVRTADSAVIEAIKSIPPAENIDPPRFLGKNGQRVLILVEDSTSSFLDETSFNFLVTILNACKLSMEDVALVNVAGMPPAARSSVAGQLQSRIVLSFGVDITGDLNSPALAEIAADRAAKGTLWSGLKQLFTL